MAIGWAPPERAAFFDPRRKLPLLVSDLGQLGYREEAIAHLPVCPLPPAATNSQMLGRWYVLEGSTLGGQLVAKMLGDRLSLRPGQCRFFLSYGDEVGNKWREFCGLLDTYSSPESNDAVIEAADQTFQSLAAWMR